MAKSKKELEQNLEDEEGQEDCFGHYLKGDKACEDCLDVESCKTDTNKKAEEKENEVAKKKAVKEEEVEVAKETESKTKTKTKTKTKAKVAPAKSKAKAGKITYPVINGVVSPFKDGTTAFIVFKAIVDKKKATLDRIVSSIEKSGLKCSDPANRAKKVANVLVTASYKGIKAKTFVKTESKGKISYEYVG